MAKVSLQVIDDNFLRLSGATQNVILGVFALSVATGGLFIGGFKDLKKLLPEEELDKKRV